MIFQTRCERLSHPTLRCANASTALLLSEGIATPYLVARSFAFVAERLSSQSRHVQEICCEKSGENRTSFFEVVIV